MTTRPPTSGHPPAACRSLVEVAPGVLVATSRTMTTTSTLLAGGSDVLLVDPAWHPDELDGLVAAVRGRGLCVVGGLATHAHHDHLLWHPGFGDAPRWASVATARLAQDGREAMVAELRALDDLPAHLADLVGRVRAVPDDPPALPAESVPPGFAPELVVHDGHAPGHTAVWLPDQRVLLAGDMLSDVELPLPFDPDDLSAYRAALDRLAPYAAAADVVVPGHGTPGTDALARLDADRRYLDDVLHRGRSDDPRQANLGMAYEHARLLRVVGRG
ncbi:MBL fold metallo-hydrolase [Luteimicrobium subarcticum]|uniref:Glyoxylase-like metal-dependent hydrolase (Beta-lactamase superfamily II) n=1 Tax=Luteimicrobium subarcticum TaxID=620910 RepID=A0A2M8WJK7_9MICO|nr:MBL fold metallo-hydrolase [Luteimicrobium subarcticum]PJI91120.1 glyoxylase-like metal-dependent hydrolase (beta-lactamase superfamily II) [Luteimicrobium subarcticum]